MGHPGIRDGKDRDVVTVQFSERALSFTFTAMIRSNSFAGALFLRRVSSRTVCDATGCELV